MDEGAVLVRFAEGLKMPYDALCHSLEGLHPLNIRYLVTRISSVAASCYWLEHTFQADFPVVIFFSWSTVLVSIELLE